MGVIVIIFLILIVFGYLFIGYDNTEQRQLEIQTGINNAATSMDSYKWESKVNKDLYKTAVWHKIEFSRLSGLASLGEVVENADYCDMQRKVECPDYNTMTDKYLRREGFWMQQRLYYLEMIKNGETREIGSLAMLKRLLAPIDSEMEAASLIGVTTSDLMISQYDILEGHTATIGDEYLVQVISNMTFGCGDHTPVSAIYKVTKDGEIENIAYKKVAEPGPKSCVD